VAARRIVPPGSRGSARFRDLRWRDRRSLGFMAVSLTALVGFSYLSIFAESEVIQADLTRSLLTAGPILVWAILQWVFVEVVQYYELGRGTRFIRGMRFGLLLLVAALTLGALIDILGSKTFWLPRERLDFQNEASFTGYVIRESGDYLVLLKDKPRVIIERKKDMLDDRDFCHPRPTDEEAVSEKVQSNTPVCP
jgi:hypothetical protein